jgi:hypothetical protein
MSALVVLAALAALAPDHARLQTGGFSGMVALGVGYSAAQDRVTVDASYGWVPPRHGAPTAHLGTLALGLRPLRGSLSPTLVCLPLYVTVGLYLGHGSPARAAAVADDPVAVWGLLSLGAELAWVRRSGERPWRHALYVEEVALSPHLYAVVSNAGLHATEAFSTALGYRVSF